MASNNRVDREISRCRNLRSFLVSCCLTLNVRRYLEALHPLPDITSGLKDLKHLGVPPPGHIPRTCKDAALTSFAQSGCLRLGARRALICLLDSKNQYVLTEATQTLSLQEDLRHEPGDELWLGSAVFPRGHGISDQVIEQQKSSRADDTVKHLELLVINDLQEDVRFQSHPNVVQFPHNRFFAGVALVSDAGIPFGVYCVYDDKPRAGLSDAHCQFLRDISHTIADYLLLGRVRQDHRRKEQMLRGLGSFIQGMKELAPYEEGWQAEDEIKMASRLGSSRNEKPSSAVLPKAIPTSEVVSSPDRQDATTEEGFQLSPKVETMPIPSETGSPDSHAAPLQPVSSHDSRPTLPSPAITPQKGIEDPKDETSPRATLQPKGALDLFNRAASIIRDTSDLSGVVFVDASLSLRSEAANPFIQKKDISRPSENTDAARAMYAGEPEEKKAKDRDSFSESEGKSSESDVDGQQEANQKSTILGSATVGSVQHLNLRDSDIRTLLRKYPNGRVFSIGADGGLTSSDDSGSDSDYHLAKQNFAASIQGQTSGKDDHVVTSLFKTIPTARSLAVLPLWHYEQERWSVLSIFWIDNSVRSLSSQDDLLFFRIFGNGIMNGLARLDAVVAEKSKNTFISSISHEMRSPLHGILGSLALMQGTIRDGFQADMIDSIEQSGRTMLDVVDNILDFSKINDFSRSKFTSISKRKPVRRGSPGSWKYSVSKQGRRQRSALSDNFDLSLITEEVIEATYAAQSFRILDNGWGIDEIPEADDSERPRPQRRISADRIHSRKHVRVILDVSASTNWVVQVEPGIWRRIVMNVMGNALKFTSTGYVKVSLQVTTDSDFCKVKFVVTDTGRGISPEYLASKIYTPFSQEDSFAAGTGLGLSIVRRLLKELTGHIDIKSEPGSGTQVKVSLALPNGGPALQPHPGSKSERLSLVRSRLGSTKVCVLSPSLPDSEHLNPKVVKGEAIYGESLIRVLKDWFNVDAVFASSWDPGSADIVICTEPSFEALAETQKSKSHNIPQVIFICLDAFEAAALRDDVRIRQSVKPVEIVIQPVGPFKLSRGLEQCLERIDKTPQSTAAEETTSDVSYSSRSRYSEPNPSSKFESRSIDMPDIVDQASTPSRSPLSGLSGQGHSVEAEPMETREFDSSKASILIVDDNPINLKVRLPAMSCFAIHFVGHD